MCGPKTPFDGESDTKALIFRAIFTHRGKVGRDQVEGLNVYIRQAKGKWVTETSELMI